MTNKTTAQIIWEEHSDLCRALNHHNFPEGVSWDELSQQNKDDVFNAIYCAARLAKVYGRLTKAHYQRNPV